MLISWLFPNINLLYIISFIALLQAANIANIGSLLAKYRNWRDIVRHNP